MVPTRVWIGEPVSATTTAFSTEASLVDFLHKPFVLFRKVLMISDAETQGLRGQSRV